MQTNQGERLVLGKIESGPEKSPCFYFSLTIENDLTWKLHVMGVEVLWGWKFQDAAAVYAVRPISALLLKSGICWPESTAVRLHWEPRGSIHGGNSQKKGRDLEQDR